MSSAKYSPAPQVDPDEAAPVPPQTPPSYQATASSSHATDAGIFGNPRSSEDNLPDDFKFGCTVGEATIDIRHQFIRKVYAILCVQLLATTAVSSLSFFSDGYRTWIQSHPSVFWLSIFGTIGCMFLTYWKRKSYPINLVFLSLFTLVEAYTISVLVSFYSSHIVLNALVLSAGLFIFLTLFACQTKYDFTSWYPYLFGALWFLLIFGLITAFFPSSFYSSTRELVYGGLGTLLFSAYILVDTQMVMYKVHVEEEIAAAIALYLDIINLFVSILRLLNNQDNN